MQSMNANMKSILPIVVSLSLIHMCSEAAASGKPAASSSSSSASSSAGGGSRGGGGGGGGGNSHSSTATVPATSLVFSAASIYNGVAPQCAGTYSISPYYPTLSLITLNIKVSSLNIPDGTTLYVTANGPSGPVVSGALIITAQTGTYSITTFCAPIPSLQSVTITDLSGAVIFTGH